MSIQAALSVRSSIKRPIRPRSFGTLSRPGSVIPFPSVAVGIASVWGSVNNFPGFHIFIASYPSLDDRPLLLAQGAYHGRSQIQVRLHQFRWGQGHPLVQRDVGEARALEHFQEAQHGVTGVLDVVP